ncbi:MAG TPA: bifunctional UDP-N-acetylmuramoyl-tripeptide:D-alanyl-D-alanine ligase/alanine racemase, partial [Chitinophagaceae bacterium]
MTYSAISIVSIVNGRLLQKGGNSTIAHLVTDSRKVYVPETSLFFALAGARRDGHMFVHELYRRGLRNFVISKPQDLAGLEEANIIRVEDTL